ncbi:12983_t:CDS:2 [Funneliformis geosporum]|uniref:12983_t:CDS:1 n=1 Tax=Funneliformis geosporum TaxID=1117311 RepID=A0A9W4T457_9GLOM|nr:12983_t:CDS:2 [Funneliformis geosporum]
MVSHLQKDLATEKQDKVHIQKELDDTLTILNKPTTEMGTQTDLTAEQISRMEEKITNYQKDITQSQNQVNFLTNQISTLQTEIRGLQKQVKDKELNEAEKDLLDYELERRDLQTKITKLETDKRDLQTKYDMEVRTKEELIGFLSVYRQQSFLEYRDFVLDRNKTEIEEFLKQHTPYLNRINLIVFKLTSDRVIDFN